RPISPYAAKGSSSWRWLRPACRCCRCGCEPRRSRYASPGRGCRMDRGGDAGGATVFACVALVALIAVTSMFVGLGTVVVARHRAQAGADLGALAAAGALSGGTAQACAEAVAVVRRMSGAVTSCDVTG